jgi:hypothetical protein
MVVAMKQGRHRPEVSDRLPVPACGPTRCAGCWRHGTGTGSSSRDGSVVPRLGGKPAGGGTSTGGRGLGPQV